MRLELTYSDLNGILSIDFVLLTLLTTTPRHVDFVSEGRNMFVH
jgi:hypothetical protein